MKYRIRIDGKKYRAQRKIFGLVWYDIEWDGFGCSDWPMEYQSRVEAESVVEKHRNGTLWQRWQTT